MTAIAVGVGAVAVGLGKMVGKIVDAETGVAPDDRTRSGLTYDGAAAADGGGRGKAGSEDGLEGCH